MQAVRNKVEKCTRIGLEPVTARFLVRVQVEEQIQGISLKRGNTAKGTIWNTVMALFGEICDFFRRKSATKGLFSPTENCL